MRVSDITPGHLTASLVVSPGGDHVGSDGTSKSLGGQADFEWFIWLRNRAEVILTSGKTFRDEGYKTPKNSRLAVFSRGREELDLFADAIFIDSGQASSFQGAVNHLLSSGYNSIHCEFGPTGFVELIRGGEVECFLSCEALAGIRAFTDRHGLQFEIAADEELVIARMGSVAVP